jgi:membrane associated rhomboid family serine protease
MNKMTDTVKHLLIINVLFFIGTISMGEFNSTNPAFRLLSLYFPENPNFHFWQPITHMFMHGGVSHILFNMFALYSFGIVLESFWGGKKFLFFYISCGLGSVLIHFLSNYYYFESGMSSILSQGFSKTEIMTLLSEGKFNPKWQQAMISIDFNHFVESYSIPSVGASGAIYGLLVAFAFMFPNAELGLMFIPIPIKAKYFVPIYMLLYDGFFGIFGTSFMGIGSGVAHYAHIGGALTGFIMMWFWKKNQFNDKRWN